MTEIQVQNVLERHLRKYPNDIDQDIRQALRRMAKSLCVQLRKEGKEND